MTAKPGIAQGMKGHQKRRMIRQHREFAYMESMCFLIDGHGNPEQVAERARKLKEVR